MTEFDRRLVRLLPLTVFLLTLNGCQPKRTTGSEAEPEQRSIDWNRPHLVVDPQTTRSIQGISEVDRKRYFSICDSGNNFDQRVRDEAMYHKLVEDLGISFGRALGLVKHPARSLKEDPDRPGFADLSPLEEGSPSTGSERMQQDFGPNLNVAMHGNHNAYPEYMGKFVTRDSTKDPDHSQWIPQNIEAAAELAAAVLKHNYTDFTRPRYYEPVNEPHWSFFDQQHMADWHLKTMEKVHASTPDVLVGGLCMSVCYFYRNDYKSFNGIKNFMDRTEGKMDFYSFHTYDYHRWVDGQFQGRMQSGLPLEGGLDLIPNYSVNQFGKEVPMVISEQGGYNGARPKGTFDGELTAAGIMSNAYPNADHDSWEIEMKKRSVVAFDHVSSIIANTLSFMDHPHTVQKAVPFILFTTWGWGPEYYAQLYVPNDYTNRTEWVEQDMLGFYKFFRGLNGRRVKALCSDPDLQTRAFVDGSKLYLVVNNQSRREETVDLYGIETDQLHLRRIARNADYTMAYSEETVATPETLRIQGRESLMMIADFGNAVEERDVVNEVVCYGDRTAVPLAEAEFNVQVANPEQVDYAQLRVGLTRPSGLSQAAIITFNGVALDVPLEDCADRLTDREYASTKLVALDPTILQQQNVVKVSFPDGVQGSVGSVVIRAAYKK